MAKRRVLARVESVIVRGRVGAEKILAKVDTGAARSVVDAALAARVGLGPATRTVRVRGALARTYRERPVTEARLGVLRSTYRLSVGIADRSRMRYPVLLGMDLLRRGRFLVDPSLRRKAARRPPRARRSPRPPRRAGAPRSGAATSARARRRKRPSR